MLGFQNLRIVRENVSIHAADGYVPLASQRLGIVAVLASSRGLGHRGPRGVPQAGTTDREGGAMGRRKRTVRRFQVEAPEGRLAPGAAGGAVSELDIRRRRSNYR